MICKCDTETLDRCLICNNGVCKYCNAALPQEPELVICIDCKELTVIDQEGTKENFFELLQELLMEWRSQCKT